MCIAGTDACFVCLVQSGVFVKGGVKLWSDALWSAMKGEVLRDNTSYSK